DVLIEDKSLGAGTTYTPLPKLTPQPHPINDATPNIIHEIRVFAVMKGYKGGQPNQEIRSAEMAPARGKLLAFSRDLTINQVPALAGFCQGLAQIGRVCHFGNRVHLGQSGRTSIRPCPNSDTLSVTVRRPKAKKTSASRHRRMRHDDKPDEAPRFAGPLAFGRQRRRWAVPPFRRNGC